MSLNLFNLQKNMDWYKCVMLNNDLNKFILNTKDIELDVLTYQNQFLPVSVCHSDEKQAWVVSPLSTYIDYAQEETLRHLPKPWSSGLVLILNAVKMLLKQGHFSRAAILNNWLVSTNLYPDFHEHAVNEAMDTALKRYPQHAIWWRSLNAYHHAPWLHHLQKKGCLLIPSRRIFVLDRPALAQQQHRDWKNDQKLALKTDLVLRHNHELKTDTDYETITLRYNQLYLEKYSTLNPQYTAKCIKAWHEAGLLYLQAWEDQDGILQGVAGSIHNQRQLTTPIFGFNTDLPQKNGLYRLNNLAATNYAISQDLDLNLSAGAAHFKQQRGAIPIIEYSAVYAKHLPIKQQAVLKLVQAISRYIGEPMLKRMDL